MPKKHSRARRQARAAGNHKPRAESENSTNTAPEDTGAAPTSSDVLAFPVVAIGASAGGLEALESFFRAVPADCDMAFVIVTHLDPDRASALPELLQKCTTLPVSQIRDGIPVASGSAYLIPPGSDLIMMRGKLQLMPPAEPRGANLPIDRFFRSLARDQGANAIGIVLSGTGSDGTMGIRAIKEQLGTVIVQDPESAKYAGMPQSAEDTGLADLIIAPEKMPETLLDFVIRRNGSHESSDANNPEFNEETFQKICFLLREVTGHDFSLYKKTTIFRRIQRRMNLHQIDDISEYIRYLQGSKREATILFKDVLIGVTNFFRDSQAFDFLSTKVLPEQLLHFRRGTYRVWVPGCSTGEEAYSLAIALHESLGQGSPPNIQVFGTDIDEDAIEVARTGIYPAGIAPDVGNARVDKYFLQQEDGRYQVKQLIREMVIFAPHDVVKDPPFTKLDLISCRNLLIYFGSTLQETLIPLFHYGLNLDGILFLGTSETIGRAADEFTVLSKKWKIFQRGPVSESTNPLLRPPMYADVSARKFTELERTGQTPPPADLEVLRLVEAILSESDAPSCIVVDSAFDIVYVHGRLGNYFEPAQGRASVNALKMARPELRMELGAAIRRTMSTKQEVRQTGLHVNHGEKPSPFNLIARPVQGHESSRNLTMVTFEELKAEGPEAATRAKGRRARVPKKSTEELELELRRTRENLQNTIEELEISNEELKSTNEELQSTNEELQSTNEELETSKEELQSLNEESATVNAELQSRIDELSTTNDDMKNLLDSTDIATVFLDTKLRIRRFTPAATPIIPLGAGDTGRPLRHFATMLLDFDLSSHAAGVLADLASWESEVSSQDGKIYAVKIRPYRTVNNVIDGVVVTFHDVTALRSLVKCADSLALDRDFAFGAMDLTGVLAIALTLEGKIVRMSKNCSDLLGVSRAAISDLNYWDVLVPPDSTTDERAAFFDMSRGSFPAKRKSFWHDSDTEPRWIEWSYIRASIGNDTTEYILGAGMLTSPP